jgi:hydroxymethylpyrimidine/phosphomethylpyrimidine kinase
MLRIALTVAGSDSSGGAGIQADLKTFSRLKVYGTSVITAVTAQNTAAVEGVFEVPAEFVARQWDAVMTDIPADAVKTGMLVNAAIIETVAAKVREYGVEKLVVDPVMISTSGKPLLHPDAIQSLKQRLAPLAVLMTPNLNEARTLTGLEVRDKAGMEEAARRIHDFGSRYVLVKGGHIEGDARDVLFDGVSFSYFSEGRILAGDVHGAGCVMSAAIASHLALGKSVEAAVQAAKGFVTEAIRRRLPIGKGANPCDPLGLE